MARPKLQLDEREILNYAKLGASNSDIARMLGCDEGTIRNRFSEIVDKARAGRRTTLREMQWKAAKAGNVAMLIFLGKNELDQADKQQVDVNHEHILTVRAGAAALAKDPAALCAVETYANRMDTLDLAGSNGHASNGHPKESTNGNGHPHSN